MNAKFFNNKIVLRTKCFLIMVLEYAHVHGTPTSIANAFPLQKFIFSVSAFCKYRFKKNFVMNSISEKL